MYVFYNMQVTKSLLLFAARVATNVFICSFGSTSNGICYNTPDTLRYWECLGYSGSMWPCPPCLKNSNCMIPPSLSLTQQPGTVQHLSMSEEMHLGDFLGKEFDPDQSGKEGSPVCTWRALSMAITTYFPTYVMVHIVHNLEPSTRKQNGRSRSVIH